MRNFEKLGHSASPIAEKKTTVLSAALMFEYAFGLIEEGALIREAVTASMDACFVTEDITTKPDQVAHSTSEVGEWLVNYIKG